MGNARRTIAVIDTNVFIGAADEPFKKLENTDIVIPTIVLQELEQHRGDDGNNGWACRTVLHYLEDIRKNFGGKALMHGAKSYHGNTVRIESDHKDLRVLGEDLNDGKNDSTILAIAKNLDNEHDGRVILITNDLPMRIKADVFLGLKAEPYGSDISDTYTGKYALHINKPMKDIDEDDILDAFDDAIDADEVVPYRSMIQVFDSDDDISETFIKSGDSVKPLQQNQQMSGIRPKNIEQQVAASYLLDNDITCVTLGGVAGAGKSLLALSAGMELMDRSSNFDKIVVFRSMYEVGQQKVGYLPGDIDEKMAPWAQAIWDNVAKIDKVRSSKNPVDLISVKKRHEADIEISPISWIRGRTIDNAFIIVDDAQSLEKAFLLNIMTRLGRNSRIVMTYDIKQQDNPNPHMSIGTSIVSLVNDVRGNRMFAHMDFDKSERSEIAQFASSLIE